jgi:hypothetical protein
MDIIDVLLGIERKLDDWIYSSAATTTEEKVRMSRVFGLRDKFAAQTNQVVLQRLQLAGLDIREQTVALADINKKLEATAKNISTALTVIDLVSCGVGVLTSILSLF